jgi:hypothetical protein
VFLSTLVPRARDLLEQISGTPVASGFYLAGGSAVALHLGHRVSVDLGFFTPSEHYEAEPLLQALRGLGRVAIQQQGTGTLVASVDDVQVSFFVYPYPVLDPFAGLDLARIASLLDLGLMMVVAISQRERMRDFIDLHAVCRSGHDLASLFGRLPAKYPGISLPTYHLLRALVYFDDAEQDPPPAYARAVVVGWDQELLRLPGDVVDGTISFLRRRKPRRPLAREPVSR